MEQQAAVREVTKHYNGIHLSARMTATFADGNNHWTGAIIGPDGAARENFMFSEREQVIMLPASAKERQVHSPELREFARFCAEVSQAHI